MNDALGNAGESVVYGPSPVFEAGEDSHDPALLLGAIDRGEVPAPSSCSAAIRRTRRARRLRNGASRFGVIPTTAYLGGRSTRTGQACGWFVPELHFLEAWSNT